MLGKEMKTIILTEKEREVTAFHEAGHTLGESFIARDTDPLHKVTIIPRGKALGCYLVSCLIEKSIRFQKMR